jgi:hypothetical protein
MSISTPVNAQQNTHSEVQLNSTFKAYSFETQTEPKKLHDVEVYKLPPG